MRLTELLSNIPTLQTRPFPSTFVDREVSGLFFDHRKIVPGSVFVAIRGSSQDGHKFVADAVARGAGAVVVENIATVPDDFSGITGLSNSTRESLAHLASRFHENPSQNLFTVAVTGTNGKTTTTHMVEHVLTAGGMPTGVIGTINHHLGSRIWPTSMTTPDPVEFQSRLLEFRLLGAKAVALEASSHALDQFRLDAVDLDTALFTNLTRDHLDYHHSMETYFRAKLRLFDVLLKASSKKQKTAVFNGDDEWGRKAAEATRTFGLKTWVYRSHAVAANAMNGVKADFRYRILEQGFDGVRFELESPAGRSEIRLAMPGVHNVQNAVCAFATGLSAGLDASQISKALEDLSGVPGRLERVPNETGKHVFVDYAHTDDALAAILLMLRSIRETAKTHGHQDGGARLITVFGCGGDRDRGKRPLMMRAALDGSDVVVLTSDNPRSEDPERILDDAMAAVSTHEHPKVLRYVDRKLAIAKAIETARVGDVILIAGKGHETTQQIGNVKYPFSDAQVALELLEGVRNG